MRAMIKSNLKRHIGTWPIRLLDQLLPPRCLSCGVGAQDNGRICSDCWKGLTFLQGPACAYCGYPFDFDHGVSEAVCGQCLSHPPAYDRARAAVRYDDGSRRMIISFKHGDRTDYGNFFSQLLTQASHGLDMAGALVVPVPLHKKRLQKRRYNQAALIAGAFARKKALDHCPDLLIRRKHTPPQEGNHSHRRRNVAGAFRLNSKYGGDVKDRTIVLIDDVYTTGATVQACAQILKRAGVGAVNILTIARVCQR